MAKSQTPPTLSEDIFYENSDLTPEKVKKLVTEGLRGSDYGEFFREESRSEYILKDKGVYSSSESSNSGFGFSVGRGVYAMHVHADNFNTAALKQVIRDARVVLRGSTSAVQQLDVPPPPGALYLPLNPMQGMTDDEKRAKIDKAEEAIYKLDPRITNITLTYSASYKAINIVTADGRSLVDQHPRAHFAIKVQLTEDNNRESAGRVIGGVTDCRDVFNSAAIETAARSAIEQADKLLRADYAPAGQMDVVLGAGPPSVLLHEAVGHGLEGDFNRKGTSVYSGKIGEQVAARGVTIIDRGDLPGVRGSRHFDDEGTPMQNNVLVEDGILVRYMQDSKNALLMGDTLSGNGRRQDFRSPILPRMTNTLYANGTYDPQEIIASVEYGLYIPDVGSGQVDIVTGDFNMNVSESVYLIENGRVSDAPLKGASMIGDGLTVIQNTTMVGNDLSIDSGPPMTCGKNGQSVPVGIGQPTIKVSGLTIGGLGKG